MVDDVVRNLVVFVAMGLAMAVVLGTGAVFGLSPHLTLFALLVIPVLLVELLLPGLGAVVHRSTGVDARTSVPPFLLGFLGLVVLDVVADPSPPDCRLVVHRPCLQPFHFALAAYGASLVALGIGLANWARYRRLRAATELRATDAGSGLAYVEGTIRQSSSTLTAPVSDEEAVLYHSTVESEAPLATYVEEERTSDATPFEVESADGAVRIEPDTVRPYDLTAYANEHTVADDHHRREERYYSPGDMVTVVGESPPHDAGSDPTIARPTLMGGHSYDELFRLQRRRTLLPLLIGVLGSIASYAGMFLTG